MSAMRTRVVAEGVLASYIHDISSPRTGGRRDTGRRMRRLRRGPHEDVVVIHRDRIGAPVAGHVGERRVA